MNQNVICRLFGHKYRPDAARYYCVFDCDRCGSSNGHEPGLFKRIWIRFYLWQRDTRSSFRRWLKCSECGLYFGRHDETKDHLPF